MTFYDDPNREAVGLEPIWTGAGETEEPPPEVEPPVEEPEAEPDTEPESTEGR